ncbi:MAG: efflux RND transporter periplasmic adaptor subunit [Gemmataceae bacterium]
MAKRVIVALLIVAPLIGCQRGTAPARSASTGEEAPASIEVVKPVARTLRRMVDIPGAVLPHEESQLYARVPGYIQRILVDIGQPVKGPRLDASGNPTEPGQILAEIAVPELTEERNHKRALVRQEEAMVEQARRALAAAEANIASTEAAVVEARASEDRWGSEARRMTRLVDGGVMDVQTLDETRKQHQASTARVQAAAAAVKKARADRDKAEADVGAAEARVEVARTEVRRLDAMLVYAQVRAPIDGVVTRRRIHTGDFVQPAAARGDCMFTISRLHPVRIVLEIPEADSGLVAEKTLVSLSVPALRPIPFQVAITRTSWSLNPGSRTLRAEIDLPNPDGKVRPGMYAYARVTGEHPARWALPASALIRQGEQSFCFRVQGDKVVRTPVQVGRTDAQFVEVVKLQGADASTWIDWNGEEVVALRASNLTDKQPVQIRPATK